VLVALLPVVLAAPPAEAGVRAVRVLVNGSDLVPDPSEGEPSRRAGRPETPQDSWLISQVLAPGLVFSAVGLHWTGLPDAGLELSVSADGARWGPWITVPPDGTIASVREDGEPNPWAGETRGALVFVDPGSRLLRCRARPQAGPAAEGAPDRIAFHVIDAGLAPEGALFAFGPGTTATPGPGGAVRAQPVQPRRAPAPPPEIPDRAPPAKKPPISSRASWGARPPKAAYTHTLAGHLGVHHTATVEDGTAGTWEECAARLRAIQAWHMDTNGWNDIGYAYVVCGHGHVFQAREDDDDATDVQGAHDGFNRGSSGLAALGYFHPPVDQRPSGAQLAALVELAAWIASRRDIDPLGRSFYAAFGAPVDNVYGHRDVGATACPGDHLYNLLAPLRTAIGERVLRQVY
jgi:hypothetical protein